MDNAMKFAGEFRIKWSGDCIFQLATLVLAPNTNEFQVVITGGKYFQFVTYRASVRVHAENTTNHNCNKNFSFLPGSKILVRRFRDNIASSTLADTKPPICDHRACNPRAPNIARRKQNNITWGDPEFGSGRRRQRIRSLSMRGRSQTFRGPQFDHIHVAEKTQEKHEGLREAGSKQEITIDLTKVELNCFALTQLNWAFYSSLKQNTFGVIYATDVRETYSEDLDPLDPPLKASSHSWISGEKHHYWC